MSRLALGRLRLRRKMGLGANNPDQGVGVPILPEGFAFLVDGYGRYFVDLNGNFFITAVP